MNLILHIGPYKTGTSAIQEMFKSNYNKLLSDGFYYVFPKNAGKNLNVIGSLLYHGKTEFSKLIFNLHKNAVELKCHTVIISAESLWNIKKMYDWHNKYESVNSEKELLQRLKTELLKYFDEITILYLRRKESSLYNSLYNQLIKDVTDLSKRQSEFNKLFKSFFDYDKTISVWNSVFRSAKYIDLAYNKNITSDVCNTLGIELPKTEFNSNPKYVDNILIAKWLTNDENSSYLYRVYKYKAFMRISIDNQNSLELSEIILKSMSYTFSSKYIFYSFAKTLHGLINFNKKIYLKK